MLNVIKTQMKFSEKKERKSDYIECNFKTCTDDANAWKEKFSIEKACS